LEDNSIVGLSAKTLLAKIAFENKDFEGSGKIVEEILDANSSYDDARILQARLLLLKEQYDEAIALLNKVTWSAEGSEEANLFLLTPPFNEGWVRFEVSATNATTGCTDLFPAVPTPGDCQVLGYDVNYDTVATPATKYVPAYLGLVFTTGSEALGCAPAFYNNQNIVANWFGRAGDSR